MRRLLSISKPSPKPKHNHVSFHSKPNPIPNDQQLLIDTISNSLQSPTSNWQTLSTKFSTIHFTESLINQILLRHINPEHAKHALNFFHWSSNPRHVISTYSITIHILVRAQLLIDAKALIESSILNHSNSNLLDSLLNTYDATSSTPLVFDLLIQCYAKLRLIESGFNAFKRLNDCGFLISVISFNTLLHYASKLSYVDLVWRIYEFGIDKRVYPNETTYRIMIGSLCKEGKLKEVVDLIDKINRRCFRSPVVIVNTRLVFRVLEEGRVEDGMSLLKRLLMKNMVIDTIGYSLVVYAKTIQGDLESARGVFDEMVRRGFSANAFVCTAFVRMYCEMGDVEEAEGVVIEMESSGVGPYEETFNLLVEGCARFGREGRSLEYCEIMVARGFLPSCLAFNEMAERLSKRENVERANEILTKAMDKGFLPDERTYSHLIQGFIREGNDIEQALKLFYEMEYRKISPGLKVFSSLIVGLCSCGEVEAGEKYLRIMKTRLIQPDADIYEALNKAYKKNGHKANVDRVYDEMMSIR